MGRSDEQVNRDLAIREISASTQAQRARLAEQELEMQSENQSGFYMPNENNVLAKTSGILDASMGTAAGGDAFYQGVDYGSPQSATPYNFDGGTNDLQTPNAAIDPEMLEYEQELQNVEGHTDVYYENVKKLNELSQFAASNGINIKSPDPMNDDQRNLSNHYNQMLKETMHLADRLKQGFKADQTRVDKGLRTQVESGGAVGEINSFDKLVLEELQPVADFNTTINNQGYSDYTQYKSNMERYNIMKKQLLSDKAIFEEKGMLDEVARYEDYIETLNKPTYNGNESKRIQIAKDRLKMEKDGKKSDWYKKRAKYTKAQDIAVLVANAFKSKASYQVDPSTGMLVNNSFNNMKYGPNQIISKLELVGYDGLAPTEWDAFSRASEELAGLKAKIKSNANVYTDAEKEKMAELTTLRNGFRKKFGDKEPKIKVHFQTTSSKGIQTGSEDNYTGATTEKSGSAILDGIKPFINILAENNPKTVDSDILIELGIENEWLKGNGDWDADKIIGNSYKEANSIIDASLLVAKGKYGTMYRLLKEKLDNPMVYNDYSDGWFFGLGETEDYGDDTDGDRQSAYFDISGSEDEALQALGGIHIFKSEKDDDHWDVVFGRRGETDLTGVTADNNTITEENYPGLTKMMGGNTDNLREVTSTQVLLFLRSAQILENSPFMVKQANFINEQHQKFKTNKESYDASSLVKESMQTVDSGSNSETSTKNPTDGSKEKKAVSGFGKKKP